MSLFSKLFSLFVAVPCAVGQQLPCLFSEKRKRERERENAKKLCKRLMKPIGRQSLLIPPKHNVCPNCDRQTIKYKQNRCLKSTFKSNYSPKKFFVLIVFRNVFEFFSFITTRFELVLHDNIDHWY